MATETPNNLNQLTGTSSGGPMRFAGTVSKPARITVGGNPATVRADGSYEGSAQVVGTGTTRVHIVATDSSGNVTDKYTDVTPGTVAAQSFGYDQNGNQTAAGPSSAQVTYGWDAANRLINITKAGSVTQFDYDGMGRRVREKLNGTEIKHWVWAGLDLAEERDPSNNVVKRFFAQGEQIAGQKYFFTRDHLGSVRELTDSSQTVRARYAYDVYGQRGANQITNNPVEADFGFTGHYFHQASGLHLALYRAYDAKQGRWISRDPAAEKGGVNLYAYVHNSSVNRIDLLGLWQISISGGYIFGGRVSFGNNGGSGWFNGQSNFSVQIGVDYGFSGTWDWDSNCKKNGFDSIHSINGALGEGFYGGGADLEYDGNPGDGTGSGDIWGRLGPAFGGLSNNGFSVGGATTFGASIFAGTGIGFAW